MPFSYKFSEEQKEELAAIQKETKDKNVYKRVTALLFKAEGKSRQFVAEATGYKVSYLSELTRKYMKNGLEAIVENHYKGNCRNMSFDDEKALLESFDKIAETGQILSVSDMKKAYDTALGRETNDTQIYKVLHRHGWRKVMPRSRHPKKASEEAIEASKKLSLK